MTKIQRLVRKRCSEDEIWEPHRYDGGYYLVAPDDLPPDAHGERNLAKHQKEVREWEELVAMARSGRWHIRMSGPEGSASLISPGSYVVVDVPERPRKLAARPSVFDDKPASV